ncbi:hypothetical protein TCAL_08675, partial [Tigriopus californicus]
AQALGWVIRTERSPIDGLRHHVLWLDRDRQAIPLNVLAMTKFIQLDWKIPVPEDLQLGTNCDRWTEEKEVVDFEADCRVIVDDCGFFIAWKSTSMEGDVLELSQVNDIRTGTLPTDMRLAQTLIKKYGDDVKDKSFSVCSGLDMVNVSLCHFVCQDKPTADFWKAGLRKITNNVKMNNACPKVNLQKHWRRITLTKAVDGKVSVRCIAKTFASGKTEKLVYQSLADLGLPSEKVCCPCQNDTIDEDLFTFDKFYSMYKTICPRSDIDELFKSVTKLDTIPIHKLIEFMNDRQRDPRLNEILFPSYTEKRCMEIINLYEKDEENQKKSEIITCRSCDTSPQQIGKEALTEYMLSDENAPVILDRLDIYQDMDQPLPHYYVNSSHNTYLIGKQFGGKSSVEIYRQVRDNELNLPCTPMLDRIRLNDHGLMALLSTYTQVLLGGCRCVELDCWDGKGADEGEVIITHGKAMCTNVYFKDCIEAIRDTAFVASDYPVILSFENHCNRNNQLKMANYCIDIFGDLLLKEPIPGYPLEKGKPMPPPSKLKRKILIKNKRLKPEVEKEELELYQKGALEIMDEVSEDTSAPDKKPEEGGDPAAATAPAHSGSTINVHPLLSSIINYVHPTKFQGFDHAEEQNQHFKMSSFAEPAALGYLKSQAIEFVNYNKRQISRLYPKGARVDSSNFMPQIFWNAGCQLVSLNFQTPDLPMQLNQGKFEYNGNCGYLLKPEFMRMQDKTFDPFAETPVDGVIAAQCSVTVISGQFLSQKREGTYVEVDMYGLPTDTIKKEFRTKVVPANGLNPIYNEDPFQFRKVVLPELAVLRFGVYNEEGKMLGQRILPFNDLQAGFRHIALKTEGNFPMSLPMLFCNIELKIYVPDGLGDFMDALCDPRAFLSAQEKRAEQLKALGIDETDISADVIESKSGKGAPKQGGDKGKTGPKKEDKKAEFALDPITCDLLRKEKAFQKTAKKYVKEFDSLQKKNRKERDNILTSQCKAIEKLMKSKKGVDATKDPDVIKTVQAQTQQWTEMMKKHTKAEREMLKVHLPAQEDIFKKIFETVQARQMKDLETYFLKETKDMMSSQAKVSVDTAKEVQGDATLKTKADKDRRLREKNQANTKKFMDERKNNAMKQNKRREKQNKLHATQLKDISKFIKESLEMYNTAEAEELLADKRPCCEKETVEFEAECKVAVDDCGFFVAWKSETKEGDVLELSQVNDIRPGILPNDARLAQTLIKKYGDDVKDKSFAVCSGLDMVNVSHCHFVCKDKATADVWKVGLRKITNNVKMNNACPKVNLEKHWRRITLTKTVDNKVSVRCIAKTFASGKTEKLVYQTLAEVGLPSEKNDSIEVDLFTFDKFYTIYKTICPRSDIDELFSSITKLDAIPILKMIEFMNERQRDPRLNEMLFPSYTEKRCMEIINLYEKDEENKKKKQIGKEALTEYMLSDENAPVILDRLDIYQDMDQPLPHYYVNSSHNTYLIGKQFGGKSSVEIYRQVRDHELNLPCSPMLDRIRLNDPGLMALLSTYTQVLLGGCRCVELDCWDGKGADEGEVIITHGKAMCTNVYFKDCIEAIRDTAFVASDYPVILSFENHCNRNNQLKMAKYCIEIFGDLLLREPLPGYPIFWNAGCQLVSLNFQTPDLPMQLNQGKFEYNGNCGYLLKPEFMRMQDKTFDPFAETPVDGVIAAQCSVTVISGQFLSQKREGTYVEVDMYGLPTDTIKKEFRTKVIPANGLNPIYNEDPFQFRKVVLPELAVLRFGVYNEEGKMLGQRILPFNDLQAGFRHIALKTEGNFPMSLPMLFCNIELKIYVPDGLGDFMDALCDPRAFLSAQEKRAEQLKALGIEETDISGDVIESKGGKTGGEKGEKGGKKEEKKAEEFSLDPITCDLLRNEKAFQKSAKKYIKEHETLQKKHKKERESVAGGQCKAIDKIMKSKKNVDPSKDPDIIKAVQDQTKQWTEMMNKQRKEEWEMLKAHLAAQEEIFKKVFETVQAKQMKDLEAFLGRETKEMMASQAKVSVDTAREVQGDATLKTKADKDRRLREKNQANTKRFMDERKNHMMKQNKKKEKQNKLHETQLGDISKYIKESIEMYTAEEQERKMANKRECYTEVAWNNGICKNWPHRSRAPKEHKSGRLQGRFEDLETKALRLKGRNFDDLDWVHWPGASAKGLNSGADNPGVAEARAGEVTKSTVFDKDSFLVFKGGLIGRGCKESLRPPLMGMLAFISGMEGQSADNFPSSEDCPGDKSRA